MADGRAFGGLHPRYLQSIGRYILYLLHNKIQALKSTNVLSFGEMIGNIGNNFDFTSAKPPVVSLRMYPGKLGRTLWLLYLTTNEVGLVRRSNASKSQSIPTEKLE